MLESFIEQRGTVIAVRDHSDALVATFPLPRDYEPGQTCFASSAADLLCAGEAMFNALNVIARNPSIRAFLKKEDPKALEQVCEAIAKATPMSREEAAKHITYLWEGGELELPMPEAAAIAKYYPEIVAAWKQAHDSQRRLSALIDNLRTEVVA